MNRSLALIEGNLALPIPRPFDALPPPFGSRRHQAQTTAQREPQPAARTAAHKAFENAIRRPASPANRGPFPPGAKYLFFYKSPQQRDNSHRFAEQLAEARYYLEMNRARPRSSRSDHVLGAAIFAGCSIALAWLLATCTTHNADKTTAVVRTMAQPVASIDGSVLAIHPKERAEPARPSVEFGNSASRSAPLAGSSAAKSPAPGVPAPTISTASTGRHNAPKPRDVGHLVPRPAARASVRQETPIRATKADREVAGTRVSKPQVDERLALSHTMRPAAQPFASKQPEWAIRASSATAATERAALLDWSVQQRRANITTRANTPVPGDTDWNNRMTQRRVTDNPDAFQAGSTGR